LEFKFNMLNWQVRFIQFSIDRLAGQYKNDKSGIRSKIEQKYILKRMKWCCIQFLLVVITNSIQCVSHYSDYYECVFV